MGNINISLVLRPLECSSGLCTSYFFLFPRLPSPARVRMMDSRHLHGGF